MIEYFSEMWESDSSQFEWKGKKFQRLSNYVNSPEAHKRDLLVFYLQTTINGSYVRSHYARRD